MLWCFCLNIRSISAQMKNLQVQFMDIIIIVASILVLRFPLLSYGDSVMKYGAIGDGVADDTHAFQKAWNNACNGSSKMGSVYVPAGKVFMLTSLYFTGPCKPKTLFFSIDGKIIAPSDPKKWKKEVTSWLTFDHVDGLAVVGRGLLDGQGQAWWNIHCRDHPGPSCIWFAPTMMTFRRCGNVTLKGMRFRNSPQIHVLVMDSQNVKIDEININSPENSPNTDGVHITSSSAVSVARSNIATGDDCVSIGDQTNNLNVTYVNCGPGHGVSIGSLGRGKEEVAVEDIRVWHVNFTGTTNGARIKTWPGGSGLVRGIDFFNIHFFSVQSPIIIDQFYGCSPNCPQTRKAVHIDRVRYMKMRGTSATRVAMQLNCSGSVPCSNVFMKDIVITPAIGNGMKTVSSLCNFVHGYSQGIIRPSSCL